MAASRNISSLFFRCFLLFEVKAELAVCCRCQQPSVLSQQVGSAPQAWHLALLETARRSSLLVVSAVPSCRNTTTGSFVPPRPIFRDFCRAISVYVDLIVEANDRPVFCLIFAESLFVRTPMYCLYCCIPKVKVLRVLVRTASALILFHKAPYITVPPAVCHTPVFLHVELTVRLKYNFVQALLTYQYTNTVCFA